MAKKGGLTRKVTQDNFVTEKIDVITNNLLGVYDDEGNYSIAPQIVKELVSLEKVKRSSFGNSIFCVGNLLGYGELVFELLFDSKTHNGKSASATLYLLEDVDKINGYLQNTIKTRLEDFSDSVENFIEETYDHFNISTDEDDDDEDDAEVLERKLSDDLDNEDSFIIAKKQFSLMLERLLQERFLDAYGKYFTSRISVLTKLDNDFSKAVLNSFYSQYSMIQNVFLQEQNYKNLNELLDKCFEEFSGVNDQFMAQEEEYNKAIQPSLDTFVNHVNELNEKYESKALNLLDKDDRKKVKEILENHERENDHPEYESKPSLEQMVNDVPKNVYTKEGKVASEQTQATQSKPEKTQSEEKHFIEEIKGKVTTENESAQNKDKNFYDAFKKQHSVGVAKSSKVVDTSRSRDIESPHKDGEVAASTIKDRISRLEKFKNSKQSLANPNSQQASNSGRIYDVLTREKAIKDNQIDSNFRRRREEMGLTEEEMQALDSEMEK